MAKESSSKSSKGHSGEAAAFTGLMIIGILGFMFWLYLSIGNWNIRESIDDYKHMRISSQSMLAQLRYFANNTNDAIYIWPGRILYDDILRQTPYIDKVYPVDIDAELETIDKRMVQNIVKMKPESDEIAYVDERIAKGNLNAAQYATLQREKAEALAKVLPMRKLHNQMLDLISNSLYGLYDHAMMVYFTYSGPFFVIFMIIICVPIYMVVMPKNEEAQAGSRYDIYNKKTTVFVKLIPDVLTKPTWIMSDHPTIDGNWKASSFGKGILEAWKEAGVSMPSLGADIAGYLYHHRRWPASVTGHNSYEGGLLDHTLNVTRTAVDVANEQEWGGYKRQLLLLGAMAHDIGKIGCFFYDEGSNKWHDNGAYHDKLSGWAMQCMPNYMRLPKVNREALMLAVANRHDRDGIPDNAPSFSLTLFEMIAIADDKATRKELAESAPYIGKAVGIAIDNWANVIKSLNINGWKGGDKDGMYDSDQDIAFARQPRIIDAIISALPSDIAGHIPRTAPTGQPHPLWVPLVPELLKKGMILKSQFIRIRSKRGNFYASATLTAGELGFLALRTRDDVHKDAVLLNMKLVPASVRSDWDVIRNDRVDIRPITDSDIVTDDNLEEGVFDE